MTQIPASDSDLNPRESNPTAIPADKFPAGTKFVQMAAGDSTTFVLTDEGLVYGWGTFRVSLTFIEIHNTSANSFLQVITQVPVRQIR